MISKQFWLKTDRILTETKGMCDGIKCVDCPLYAHRGREAVLCRLVGGDK